MKWRQREDEWREGREGKVKEGEGRKDNAWKSFTMIGSCRYLCVLLQMMILKRMRSQWAGQGQGLGCWSQGPPCARASYKITTYCRTLHHIAEHCIVLHCMTTRMRSQNICKQGREEASTCALVSCTCEPSEHRARKPTIHEVKAHIQASSAHTPHAQTACTVTQSMHTHSIQHPRRRDQ